MTPRKRFLLAVLAALTALSAAAQDNGTLSRPRKFNGLLGGGVSADFSENYSYITLAPEIAWPVGKYLYLGSGILAGWSSSYGESHWTFGINPYARFHAEVLAGIRVFADADLNLRRTQYAGGRAPVFYLDCGIRPGLMIPVTGSVYALVQIGFLGYESSRSGGELWSRTGWRCEGSDIRIGGYFRL